MHFLWLPHRYAIKVGVIAGVLIGLLSSRVFADKQHEFFREAGSGYDVNAYYVAINIVATFEHTLQVLLAGFASYWLRNSYSTAVATLVNFFLLSWLCVSWGLLLAVITPKDNLTVVVGFFMAFFGMLFSGAMEPVLYSTLYGDTAYNRFMELFSGFISPTRFFTETAVVNEYRCMPPQTGWTLDPNAFISTVDETTMSVAGYARKDLEVATELSYNGWYWSVLPALCVGLFVRVLGGAMIHVVDRAKQIKKPVTHELLHNGKFLFRFVVFSMWIVFFFLLGCYLIRSDGTVF